MLFLLTMFLASLSAGYIIFYLKRLIPEANSYPLLFKVVLGHRWAVYAAVCVYGLMFMVIMAQSVVMIDSWLEIGESFSLSKKFAVLITMLVSFTMMQSRTMGNLSVVSIFGLVTLLVPVVMIIAMIAEQVDTPGYPAGESVAVGSDPVAIILGLLAIVFSFSGHIIFFELINEYSDPSSFPKSLVTSQTLVLVTLGSFASIIYGLAGDAPWITAPITQSLRPGPANDIVQVLVLLHVGVVVAIFGTILSRAVQSQAEPAVKLAWAALRRKVSKRRARTLGGREASADLAVDAVAAAMGAGVEEPEAGLRKVAAPTDWSVSAVVWWMLWSGVTVVAAGSLAALVPSFEGMMVFAAALVISQTSLAWPGAFDLLALDPTREGARRIVWRVNDGLQVVLGVFFLVAGLTANSVDIA